MTVDFVVTVRIDTSVLDSIVATLPSKLSDAVGKTAYDVESDAKQMAPVLTGYLRNSIGAEPTDSPTTWIVSDGTNYGIYQELGTRRMKAQPFMVPAVERAAGNIASNIMQAFR